VVQIWSRITLDLRGNETLVLHRAEGGFQVPCSGSQVEGFGFQVPTAGFRAQGFQNSGCWFRVRGFWVLGFVLGFWVHLVRKLWSSASLFWGVAPPPPRPPLPPPPCVRDQGSGFRFQGLGFGVWSLGLRVWRVGFGDWGLGFKVRSFGFRVWVQSLGSGVQGSGFRVEGMGVWFGV